MLLEIGRQGARAVILNFPDGDMVTNGKLWQAMAYKDAGNAYLNKRRGKAVFATDFSAYDPHEHSFPAGLLPHILGVLKKCGHETSVLDGFGKPPLLGRAYQFTRPYQETATLSLLAHNSGHACVPTGGGKTYIIDALATMLGTQAVVIVPSLEILDQVHARLESSTRTHVSKLGGKDILTDSPLLVGTYQTLASRLEANDPFTARFMAGVQASIVDECHHTPCDSIGNILKHGPNIRYTYGLSATPRRKDGLEILMEGAVGPLRYEVTPRMLMEGGYIVGGEVTMMQVPHSGKMGGNPRADYHKIYKEHITGSAARRALEVHACLMSLMMGLKGMCFVKHVEHATDIYAKVTAAGQHAELLTGSIKKKDRARILDDLSSGKCRLVIATLGKEGLDVPSINAVIFAEGGSDPAQQVGRALRTAPGKDRAFIWDFYDAQHGMLEAQSKARERWYEEQGIFTLRRA